MCAITSDFSENKRTQKSRSPIYLNFFEKCNQKIETFFQNQKDLLLVNYFLLESVGLSELVSARISEKSVGRGNR